jgi:hypothetical protein
MEDKKDERKKVRSEEEKREDEPKGKKPILRKARVGERKTVCFNCRQEGHKKSECKNKRVTCDGTNCESFGHTRETCFLNHPELKKKEKGKVSVLRDEESDEESDSEMEEEFDCLASLFSMNEGRKRRVCIEGVELPVIVDTGASRTAMTEGALKKLCDAGVELRQVSSSRSLVTPDGRDISLKKRVLDVRMGIENIDFAADIEIIQGDKEKVLIGMKDIEKHIPVDRICAVEGEDHEDNSSEELPRSEEVEVTEAAVREMLTKLKKSTELPEDSGISQRLFEGIEALTKEMRELFATGLQPCPAARVLPYNVEVIETVGEKPVKARIPPRSAEQEESLFKEINSMIRLGVMRKAVERASNWTSPIISLKKDDGD